MAAVGSLLRRTSRDVKTVPVPSEIEAVIASIRKNKGENTVVRGSAIRQPFRIRTNIFTLDCALLGGIPYNRVTMVHGKKSHGKSTLAMRLVASAQASMPGQKPVWIDAEDTYDSVWAGKQAVDNDNLVVAKPDTGEDAVDMTVALIHAAETSLVVVDSLAALLPYKEEEGSAEDEAVPGLQAKLITRMMRRTTGALMKERKRGHFVTLVVLNQHRCLSRDTRIWTTRGLITMGEVQVGDAVHSPDGFSVVRDRVVTGVVPGYLVEIKKHAPLRMSRDHRHMVVGATGMAQERLASELCVGDWVILADAVEADGARGRYDLVPREVLDAVFVVARDKYRGASSFPQYSALYAVWVNPSLRASRLRLLEFAEFLGESGDEFFAGWAETLRTTRYAEIVGVSEIEVDAVDIEVDGGLFFADGVLTHNSQIGGYNPTGQAKTLPGGRALGHFTSVEILVKNKENVNQNSGRLTTNEHAFTLEKNKMCGGMRTGEYIMLREDNEDLGLFEGDVDDAATMLTFAKRLGWYSGGGRGGFTLKVGDVIDEHYANGEAAIKSMYQNREVYENLRVQLIVHAATREKMPSDFIDYLLGN